MTGSVSGELGQSGLTVEVLLEVTNAELDGRRWLDHPPPTESQRCRALVDTGANYTFVKHHVWSHMKLRSLDSLPRSDLGGPPIPTERGYVKLTILNVDGHGILTLPTHSVLDGLGDGTSFDCLLGMDVISLGHLDIDGPARTFRWSFK